MATKRLDAAKDNKDDEFYTQLSDIEKELSHYKEYFENKTILCNCDDPRVSNFFKYFALNFNNFKLKRLITTCYKNQNVDLFTQHDCEKAVWMDYRGNPNDPTSTDFSTLEIKELKGDGDFRSRECIDLLEQADIVVTNPPFSLFREYIMQLVNNNKKFIIVGNKNAVTYKEVFNLIKENKVWIGYRNMNSDFWLEVPEGNKYEKIVDGKKLKHIMACWYTNLPTKKQTEEIIPYKEYTPEEYPKYENYDAINVDSVVEIPKDYMKTMGVPLTFLDKYNPDQFEIMGLGIRGSCEFSTERRMEILDKNGIPTGKYTINDKVTLYRKHLDSDTKPAAFKDCETGELYQSIYARILIKRKK